MKKYTIKDIEKAINFLKKNCQSEIVAFEFDERGRLLLKASDLAGNAVTVIVFDEAAAKFPEITKTERLL